MRQQAINAETDGNWSLYAVHRAQVTKVVFDAVARHRSARLCVLGAGNCNDMSLADLGRSTAEIHMVDIDDAALRRGVARALAHSRSLGRQRQARLVTHGGIDLTGVACLLAEEPLVPASTIAQRALVGPTLSIGQPFDVVVSGNALTQLISLPVTALGQHHPNLTEVVLAIRTGHLRLMARLLRPGGHAVLITDVVSSDTTPALTGATPQDLLMHSLSAALVERNFFTGVNPLALVELLRTDPVLAGVAVEGKLSGPWVWQVGSNRMYLVIALTFRRSSRTTGRGGVTPRLPE